MSRRSRLQPLPSLLPGLLPEVPDPSPSPRYTELSTSGQRVRSRHERRDARAHTLDQLALIGQEINTPPIPEEAIAFIARFLVHATLPYSDPGEIDYWERTSGELEIVFEPGLAPKDRNGRRRRVGIPYGVYPRLIFSWITSEAVRTGRPLLELGDTFTDWIRSGLRLNPTGGPNGTITRIREQMNRMLAMKISITSASTGKPLFAGLSIVPIEGVAAFWDPLQPEHHGLKQPRLQLNQRFFEEALRASVPFDDRVQLALAKRHACMAIDLYRLLTLKQFHLFKSQARVPELIPWATLAGLLGHGNKRRDDFTRAVADALQLVLRLYPDARAEARKGGLLLRPGAPHIPVKPKTRRCLPQDPAGRALAEANGSSVGAADTSAGSEGNGG